MAKKVNFAITIYFRVKDSSVSARDWFDEDSFYEETSFLADFDEDFAEEEEYGTYVLTGVDKSVNIEKILIYFSAFTRYVESIVIDWYSDSVPLKVPTDTKTIANIDKDNNLLEVFGESCGRYRYNSETETYYKFMSPEAFMDRRAAF